MGRSKEFEENVALEKAMKLFWEQGYEKTSMNDLTEHMGIHRRSLYDTFTDKHTLYLKAMDRFSEQFVCAITNGTRHLQTAREALQFIFNSIIEGEPDAPPGCMMVNSAIELANRDPEIDARSRAAFERAEDILTDIVARGQENGEFTTRYEARELAEQLHNALLGLRVTARTSLPKEKLQQTAKMSIRMIEK